MDGLLVGVTIISLLLAIVMSAIAWTLWRQERERSAARTEALEALAFSDDEDTDAPVVSTRLAAPVRRTVRAVDPPGLSSAALTEVQPPLAVSVPPTAAVIGEFPDEPSSWDDALGTASTEPNARTAPASRRRPAGPPPVELFNDAKPSGAAGRLGLALAAVSLIVTAGVVGYRALHSPEIRAAVAASRPAEPATVEAPTTAHPLELLSLRHALTGTGTFSVTGLVENPPDGQTLSHVEAVVFVFDENGQYFATAKAGLDAQAIDPGDESPFVVTVPVSSPVSRYRVAFRFADGRALAHVDRRGQVPSGTTGDAIDVQPAMATPFLGGHRADGTMPR
jgi:hypothetical protein